MATLALVCGYVICVLVGLIGVAVLWMIFNGTIDLSRLISEANGDASMGRFQFLIFTFVISLSLFLVIVSGTDTSKGKPAFPESIPGGILALLGISGSSYAVGKAIQFSDPAGLEDRPVTVTIVPPVANVHFGQTQQFKGEVTRKPDAKLKWEISAGRGSIDADTGLYRAPVSQAAAQVQAGQGPAGAPAHEHATIKVTCVDYPDVSDLAVIDLA